MPESDLRNAPRPTYGDPSLELVGGHSPRRPHWRRLLGVIWHRSLEGVTGLAAIFVILVLVAVWKFSSGSLSLDVVRPNIADALAHGIAGAQIHFDDVEVRQSSIGNLASFRLTRLSLKAANGTTLAFPEAEMTFSILSLLRGQPQLRRVHLEGGDMTVPRWPFAAGAQPRHQVMAVPLADLTSAFFPEKLPADSVLLGLESVAVDNLAIEVSAAGGADIGVTLTAVYDRALTQTKLSLSGQVDLRLANGKGGSPIPITFSGTRTAGRETVDFQFDVGSFDPRDVAAVLGWQAYPQRVRVPVHPSGQVTMDQSGTVSAASLTVQVGSGVLDFAGITLAEVDQPDPNDPLDALQPKRELPKMEAIAIDGGEADLSYDAGARTVKIEKLTLSGGDNKINVTGSFAEAAADPNHVTFDLHAPDNQIKIVGIFPQTLAIDQLDLSGNYNLANGGLDVKAANLAIEGGRISLSGNIGDGDLAGQDAPGLRLSGTLENLDVHTVMKLWPAYFILGARDWITGNVEAGKIPKGVLSLNVPPDYLGSGPLQNDMLSLTFDITDAVAVYIRGLTPARRITGSATLSGNQFDLRVPEAWVGDIHLTKGRLYMPVLVPKGEMAEYYATLTGDTQKILELINMAPLRLMDRFGMDPSRVGGKAVVDLKVGRPNRRLIPVEMLRYNASAHATDFSLTGAFKGMDISGGKIDLSIDNKGILGTGKALISGLPADVTWHETFNSGDAPSTRYDISFAENAMAFRRLGLSMDEFAQGLIKGSVKTTGKGPDIYSAQIALNFKDAKLDLTDFGWQKDRDEPAEASIGVTLPQRNAGPMDVSLRMTAKGLDVKGDLRLASDYRLVRAGFPVLKLGSEMDAALTARRGQADNGLQIGLTGRSFPVGPFLKNMFGGGSSRSSGLSGFKVPVGLTAQIGKLWLNRGVQLDNAILNVRLADDQITKFDMDASYPGGGGVYGQTVLETDGSKRILISSTDAGMLISGLTGSSAIVGGNLALNLATPPKPGGTSTGSFHMQDFRVINLPLLARILSAGSFQGLSDLLTGEGLAFKRLEMGLELGNGVIAIRKGQAAGPSLGITANGYYDLDGHSINLDGTLVPLYSVNRILGVLPLIGDIFTSREGEGLLGVTYSIKGPPNEAVVMVNPLSALAPGFLRRLFQLGHDDKPPKREEPEDGGKPAGTETGDSG